MQNCTSMAGYLSRAGLAPLPAGFLKKLPQANTIVANSTRYGTSRVNTLTGVTSNNTAPSAPPTRLIQSSMRNDKPWAPETSARPASPVVTWPGNNAMVDAIFAARGSRPANSRAGKVRKDPPPASAFCTPAANDARTNTSKDHVECISTHLKVVRELRNASNLSHI